MHIDAVALSHLLAYRCEVVYVSGCETMEYRGGEVRHVSGSNYGINVDPFVEKKTVSESTSKERKL